MPAASANCPTTAPIDFNKVASFPYQSMVSRFSGAHN